MYLPQREDFKSFLKLNNLFGHQLPSEQMLFILLYIQKPVQIEITGEENLLFLSLSFHLTNLSSGDFSF